jgi:hypothetical protein
MKVIIVLFALALMQSLCLAGLDTDIAITNRVILKSGDWSPAPEDVPKCLLAIQTFLEHPGELDDYSKGDVKSILSRTKDYRVQFVGVIKDGKKVIWCNFFPAPHDGLDIFPDWKEQTAKIHDGGAWFWHIYYDPSTEKCSGFKANGVA